LVWRGGEFSLLRGLIVDTLRAGLNGLDAL
jgi:hypothetical protein